ncbi:MAG: extracellular solute-binding protein [Lachnospiraceae bacterium]|nr:extracellular solute-binding protein [Lachnospiraceae bacterium]
MGICKRILIIGTSLAALTALIACGSGAVKKTTKTPVVVTVWNYYNGAQQERFNSLVSEFNDSVGREQNIIVEAISKGTIDELVQGMQDSMDKKVGSDPLPNLYSAYANDAYAMNEAGMLADMKPYMTEEEMAAYVSGYIEEGQFESEDTLKIFPIAKSTEVLTLNRTDWEPFAAETGVTTEDLSTWEGVARVAEAYYNWAGGKAFFGRDAFANYVLVGSAQLGHEIYRVEDGKPVLDFDEETMRRLWDYYYVPYIHGYYVSGGKFRSDDLKTGHLLAYVGSTSGAPYTPTTVTYEDGTVHEISCVILPVPNFEGTDAVAIQQGAGMVLLKSEEAVEQAAVTFLKWFTQAKTNIEFSIDSGYLPVQKQANSKEFLEQVIADEKLEVSAVLKDTLDIGMAEVTHSRMYTMKPFSKSSAARTILDTTMADQAKADREQIEKLMEGGMSLEEAVGQYDTEEHFKEWYDATRQKLESVE